MDFDQTRGEIREAWRFLREKNNTIPDDVLDFMRDAALEKLDELEQIVKAERENREWAEGETKAAASWERQAQANEDRCPHCGIKYGHAMGTGDCGCDPDPE